jgi:lysine 2,3-aminomutase
MSALPAPADAKLAEVARRYDVAITPAMQALSDEPGIARQFMPDVRELEQTPQESADPIGDYPHSPVKGIVHRYLDRVLLKPLHACAVYCRFCFRREMVGAGGDALNEEELEAALAYVSSHPEVWEVILSGGDPLLLSPRRLRSLMAALSDIPHVQVIRLHTRIPTVDPERIDAELIAALKSLKAVWIGVHINHPAEFTPEARAALSRLSQAGMALVGQTVLLRGVNDDAATLENLFRLMVGNRIKPYYLHHPDQAPGTSHFRLPIQEGQQLMLKLRGRLSGLAQPSYVLDIPGGHGKVPIGPSYLEGRKVRDPQGNWHDLPNDA